MIRCPRRALSALPAVALVLLAACTAEREATPGSSLVEDADADRGREVVMHYGCSSCHRLPGVPSVDHGIGPDLSDLGERRYLGGVLPNRPESLIAWIQDPQEFAPGTVMPDMNVTEQDARDIAAYLYGQSE